MVVMTIFVPRVSVVGAVLVPVPLTFGRTVAKNLVDGSVRQRDHEEISIGPTLNVRCGDVLNCTMGTKFSEVRVVAIRMSPEVNDGVLTSRELREGLR